MAGLETLDHPRISALSRTILTVVLDAGPVRHAIHQAGDVAYVADGLEFLVAIELFDQRDRRSAAKTRPRSIMVRV